MHSTNVSEALQLFSSRIAPVAMASSSASTSQDVDTPGTALRPIYSAPAEGVLRPSPHFLTNLRPKVKSVRAACEPCRKKKNKVRLISAPFFFSSLSGCSYPSCRLISLVSMCPP